MAYEFKLPDIGEGVVEGEIVRWLVTEGEDVHADQPMVEIMTDKATVEIPAPRAGRITERLYKEGQICPVGKVLVRIDEGSKTATAAGASNTGAASAAPVRATSPAGQSAEMPTASRTPTTGAQNLPTQNHSTSGKQRLSTNAAPNLPLPAPRDPGRAEGSSSNHQNVLATPATRKLARELGVDIARTPATGPAGRITSDDVRAAAGQGNQTHAPSRPAPSAGGPDVRVPFRGLRRKIAERMVKARHEAAHFTYVEEVDCTALVDLREKANTRLAAQKLKLSYLPFIIRATVEALRRFPQMNALLDEAAGEIVQRRQYHIGLATATPEGLIVPVVRDADQRSILDLAREIDRLAALTKAGKAGRDELTGSTFTITSLGALGGVLATPILNHPEVGILGVHKISRRPAAEGDKIVLRDLMNLSISVDHRVVDGFDAARFVADIKESLESPGLLFLDAI